VLREVVAFAGVAGIIVVLPGPDMALVLRNGIAYGRRAALESALGITAGLLVWAIAAALGIAALLHASATAFTALKLAGAVYLAWLGLRALRDACRGAATLPDDVVGPRERRGGSPFRQGLLSNLFNPKIAIVFTTLIPQFVEPGGGAALQTVVLTLVFIAMGLAWLTTYALFVARVGTVLRRRAVQRVVNAMVGTVLTAFGLRLALERR
jgi:threonine/homoserine/homoserine lactone efflux protein